MWLFFDFGFVSVVQKSWDPEGTLCVRARDATSLEELRKRCPALGPTVESHNADYRFRALVSAEALGAFVGQHLAGLKVENFKDAAQRSRGSVFHDACARVWGVMVQFGDTMGKKARGGPDRVAE